MTLHLGTPWLGADEILYGISQSFWAFDACCPGVNNGLAASRTSNNLSFQEDAERQRKKAAIRVTLSLPRLVPFLTVS